MNYPERHFFTLGVDVLKKSLLGTKRQKTVFQSIKTVKEITVANKKVDSKSLGIKKNYFKYIGG